MFRDMSARLVTSGAVLLWSAAGTPASAQHHGGGHHGGWGGHHGGWGGHHYGGGHSGWGGHYGGYGHHSGYGHYPSHLGFSYGPWYGYYGYGWPYSYGPSYGVRVYSYYSPEAPAQTATSDDAAGRDYQRRAEAAFRRRDYGEAVRWAHHAAIEMPRHGKHFLVLSQALFAVGDYRGAAGAGQQGMGLLDSKEWGYVVQNFRRFYTSADYVDQLKRLEEFVEKNPDEGYARFLLGYHYGFLRYPSEARRELAKAVELEPRDELARRLLEHFGGAVSQAPSPRPSGSSLGAPPPRPPDGSGKAAHGQSGHKHQESEQK